MTVPQLPQELVEEIVDHLAGDSTSLKACSLVSRVWLNRSRSYLFETCSIVPRNILPLRDFLRSPVACTFAPYVRNVKAARYHWSKNDHHFNEIAPDLRRCLTGVRALDMTFGVVPAAHTDAFFRSGFLASFPHATQLTLTCNFEGNSDLEPPPPAVDMICRLFPALQALHVREISDVVPTSGPGLVTPAIPTPPRGLRTLRLGARATALILGWLTAANHLPHIHTLTLPVLKARDVPIVRAALQQLGGAVRHLDITFRTSLLANDVHPEAVFNFALHPSLRTLTLRDQSWTAQDPAQMDSSSHLIKLLSPLDAPELERIELEIPLSLYNDGGFDWPALDLLLSSSRFRSLRKVVVTPTERHQVEFSLPEVLPLLAASGIL
ncbi:hypothetical protein C8R46DRAFT_1213260 [Mycena filopes]|nr:hypothetical protein C8R46DRAFT_1213260 [Mycena filopes]